MNGKQVPEKTISDECKWCAENEPEWSPYAQCWIHRLSSIDKRCLRKHLSPIGEIGATDAGPSRLEEQPDEAVQPRVDRGPLAPNPKPLR